MVKGEVLVGWDGEELGEVIDGVGNEMEGEGVIRVEDDELDMKGGDCGRVEVVGGGGGERVEGYGMRLWVLSGKGGRGKGG